MPTPEKRPRPDDEIKVYGVNACLALLDRRPQDVIRIYLREERIAQFSEALRRCAREKKAYHVVDKAELDRVCASTHHEGICVLTRQRQMPSFDELLRRLSGDREAVRLVLLEDVRNPHNLGAILRVCAHFGVTGVLLTDTTGNPPSPAPSIYRTAEGGMESVDVTVLTDPTDAIGKLRGKGVRCIATSSHASSSVYDAVLPRRCLLMFGSESEGLSKRLLREADLTVAIPGTGAVESLNVACASSVCLAELQRRFRARRPS